MAAPATFEPVFAEAFSALNDVIVNDLGGKYNGFMDLISGPVKVGAAIYVVIFGYAVMRGAVGVPAREFVWQMGKLGLGIFVLFSLYASNIADTVSQGLPAAVSSAAGGGANGNPGEAFDNLYETSFNLTTKIQDAADKEAEETGTFDVASQIGIYLVATFAIVTIIFSAFIALALGFVVLIVAVFALSLLTVIGPLFVAALIFDATRSFFFAWLNVVVNYLMLLALTILVVGAVVSVGEQFVDVANIEWSQVVPAVVKVAAFFFICFIIFLMVPGIASGLGGGAAAGVNAFAGGLVGGAAGAAAASARRLGTRSVGNAVGGYRLTRAAVTRVQDAPRALTSRSREGV